MPIALAGGVCLGAAPLAAAQDAAPTGPQKAAQGSGVLVLAEAAESESPLRVTLAHELAYKAETPRDLIKNRSSAQVEYAGYHGDFFVEFNGKATAFLGSDHRHEGRGHDAMVSKALVQTSFGQTSVRAGVQPLPWGESILAPVTDEVSPRDNRELFNFNLEELRIGQAMLVVDQFTELGTISGFYIPRARYNKNPEAGSAYFFDPLAYRDEKREDERSEYGVSWKKNFDSADLTVMAAELIENEYALERGADGLVTRRPQRFRMAGAVGTYAFGDIVVRAEAAWKSGRPFYDGAMNLIEKNTVDTYLGIEYSYSSTLTMSAEVVNQHISGWDERLAGTPRNRQSLLLSATKTLMNEDLSINLLNFYNRPHTGNLTMLMSTFKWDDQLSFGLNLIVPHTNEPKSALWNVRDQKQISLKVQYQF